MIIITYGVGQCSQGEAGENPKQGSKGVARTVVQRVTLSLSIVIVCVYVCGGQCVKVEPTEVIGLPQRHTGLITREVLRHRAML